MRVLAVLSLHGCTICLSLDLKELLVCWKCGELIEDVPFPLSRLETCRACHAELHVCKLCEFYDTHVADQCSEPIADFVKEKERANFCDYFKPKPGVYIPKDTAQGQASKSELDALFGLESDNHDSNDGLSEAEKAREKLDALFKNHN